MPVCALHLLALAVPLRTFLSALSKGTIRPLVIARVVRWIIRPEHTSIDPLLTQSPSWDLLLILPDSSPLPSTIQPMISRTWTVTAGIPSRLTNDFAATNMRLLYPSAADIPPLTGSLEHPKIASSSQSLEFSPDLQSFVSSFSQGEGAGAVSMLNLLSFKPDLKSEYLKYGAAFAETVGSRRGGKAKLVGNVLSCSSSAEGAKEWDEIALAHYPSITHFADMLASEDYQAANQRWRVGSLRDTFILCTTELGLPGVEGEGKEGRAKL